MPEEIQKQPEDIFAGLETPSPLIEKTEEAIKTIEPKKTIRSLSFRFLLFPLFIIVIIGLIFGSYWLIKNSFPKSTKTIETRTETKEKSLPSPSEITSLIDKDGDGLSDEEELSLGSNLESPDTDNDGLFDKEEAKIYRTNPLNSDTDGDGVLDGVEVKKGDDPKDPTFGAKLLKLDEAINNFNF